MLRTVLILFICLALVPLPALAGQILEYKETIGGEVSTFKVAVMEKTGETIKLKAESSTGSKVYSELNGKDGSNLLWEKTKKEQKVTAIRTENRVEVTIEKKGKCEVKIHEIDPAPWIQSREFGMRGFADDPEAEMLKFWALNPSDSSMNKMMATRQEEKKIKCGDRHFEAFRVKVTLDGWKSIFWSSEFWFRKSDGVFLKYKGSASGPNSPVVVSELVKEEKKEGLEPDLTAFTDPVEIILAKIKNNLSLP